MIQSAQYNLVLEEVLLLIIPLRKGWWCTCTSFGISMKSRKQKADGPSWRASLIARPLNILSDQQPNDLEWPAQWRQL